ncbi:MAG: protein translocase subunit SecF [Ignavibacteriae bacterium]|nr:protein translocase subunit SecF [Ignavibacteriota bacterium]
MRFLQKTNIDFMARRKLWYGVSLVVIVLGLISLVVKGVDLGIDFLGGTELVIEFDQAPGIGQIRDIMNAAGIPPAEIKSYGNPEQILIRTELQGEGTIVSDRMKAAMQETFASYNPRVLQEIKIGPKIGKELQKDAVYAILFSLIAMFIYIGFRFKFIYGMGAVVALFHDVLVTLGIISIVDGLTPLTNFEIDQNMIAAFLTLVGTSVNDTVVIFDRIRENQKIYKAMGLMELINKSLNQTLSRTIITQGTIFAVILVLFLLGGEVNRGFAFALALGTVTGTYSSIYIASALVLDYTNRKLAKKSQPSVTRKVSYETIEQGS